MCSGSRLLPIFCVMNAYGEDGVRFRSHLGGRISRPGRVVRCDPSIFTALLIPFLPHSPAFSTTCALLARSQVEDSRVEKHYRSCTFVFYTTYLTTGNTTGSGRPLQLQDSVHLQSLYHDPTILPAATICRQHLPFRESTNTKGH